MLGLGASTRGLAEGFHDVPFVHPADRLAHTVTAVRALLAGSRPTCAHTSGARPLRLGLPPAPGRADLGRRPGPAHHPGGRRTGGRLVPRARWPATALAALVAELAAGWEGTVPPRRRSPWPRGPSPWPTRTPAAARDIAAACVAWYVCAMGDVYARSLTGRATAPRSAPSAPRTRVPARGAGRVPAEAEAVLDQLAATGTPDQVREQLDRWDDVADVVMIACRPGLPWEAIEATLRAAAPGAPLHRRSAGGASSGRT